MERRRPNFKSTSPGIAWESWLKSHGEVFFLYARQQTRSEADAKDVLQEALTEAWLRASGKTPDKALVFATIRRRAMDLGRSIDRRSRRESNFSEDSPSWFIPDYGAGDTRDQLATAIQELPGKLREVLILKIWGELTLPSISKLTKIPLSTVTSRYRYALERLRECQRLTELKP